MANQGSKPVTEESNSPDAAIGKIEAEGTKLDTATFTNLIQLHLLRRYTVTLITEHWMNDYPRHMFGYRTADEVFAA